jgi:hypothetical protein
VNTTPVPDARTPTEPDLAMDRQFTTWRTQDQKRGGVMARHAWYAAWRAGIQYAKTHPEVLQ